MRMFYINFKTVKNKLNRSLWKNIDFFHWNKQMYLWNFCVSYVEDKCSIMAQASAVMWNVWIFGEMSLHHHRQIMASKKSKVVDTPTHPYTHSVAGSWHRLTVDKTTSKEKMVAFCNNCEATAKSESVTFFLQSMVKFLISAHVFWLLYATLPPDSSASLKAFIILFFTVWGPATQLSNNCAWTYSYLWMPNLSLVYF